MKKITFLLSFIACVMVAQGQTLFVEDFDYTVGSAITAEGWTKHSGTATPNDSILVTNGLTFTGYPGSGIGGAAALTSYNKDQNKTFTAQTSGKVYASFMAKLGDVSRQGYFIHFASTPLTGNVFFSRVWSNATGTGTGIGAYASGVEPSPYVTMSANTTYLFVIKYDFDTKVSSLFMFSTMPTTEPTTAQASFTETATIANVGAICLRQYSWSGSTVSENITVDGIRVATSWANLFSTTGLRNPFANNLEVSIVGKKLTVTNSPSSNVEIFSAVGSKIQTVELLNGSANLNLSKGLYIVRAGKKAAKIMIQ